MHIDNLLSEAIRNKASDMHLSSGEAPMIRIDGELSRLDFPKLENDHVFSMLEGIMSDLQKKIFAEKMQVDFGYTHQKNARFRVNAFKQNRGISAAFRSIPYEIPSLQDLGMSDPIFQEICHYPNGLVLVTGPTGSGKSTTLAALINYLNAQSPRHCHILTIEDPVEYVFQNHNCLIQQREVGQHTIGFNESLKSALREDPDVIMVGEMRDLETIRLAVTAAETGHLVFATLHTSNASKTVYRIIDAFPSGEKDLIRAMLAESLRAVVAQTLMRKPGGGRVAAQEIMICTPAIRNLIREDKIPQIYSMIQTGHDVGMRSLEQHVQQLAAENLIELNTTTRYDQKTLGDY